MKKRRAASAKPASPRFYALLLTQAIMMTGAAQAADTDASTGAPSNTPKANKTASGDDAAAPSTPTSLNEVVVTAKPEGSYQGAESANAKYDQPLLDTPQSVTVIPQALIKDQNATTLQQALQNVPGITFQAGEGGTLPGDNFSIRGFNAQQDIFVDGFRDTGVYTRDPFNLQQIEVAAGPASAYSGYGSTGGSVNLVTKEPTLTPLYSGTVGFGTNSYYRDTVDINQPISAIPGAAFRLNGIYQYNEFADRSYVYNSRWGINPSIAYGLGTDTRITANYFYLEEQDLPSFGLPVVSAPGANANGWPLNHVAPVNYSNFYGLVERDYMNTTTHMGTVTIDHDFDDDIKVHNLSRFGTTYLDEITTPPRFDTGANYNIDGTPYPGSPLTPTNYPPGMMTQELRGRRQTDTIFGNQTMATTKFDTWEFHHDVVTTAELSNQQENYNTANGNNIITTIDPPSDTLSPYPFPVVWGPETRTSLNDYAFSLFDSIKLHPQWILSGGLRYDHVDATAHNPTSGTTAAYTARRTDDLASYRAAITYKPVEYGSVYFGYGTSYNPSIQGAASNSSTPAGLNPSTSDLEPEKNQSYEFGTKWELLDRKLSLHTDFFRTLKTNTRITDPSLPSGSNVYILDGLARVQGIEVGAQGNVTDAWKVFGGYTYMESRFLSGPNAGKHLPYQPNQSASLWTTYELPFHLTFGTGVTVADRIYGSTANTASVDGYVTQQALVGYELNKNVNLQLNVYNLWDENYIAAYGNGGAISGAGRTITFTTSVKF